MTPRKLVIELEDAKLESLRRIARPFGVEAEEYVATLIRDPLGLPGDEESATEIVLRAKTLRVPMRHDRAILLADFLRQLELPDFPSAVERSIRIDEHQAGVLAHLRDLLEVEIPGDYGEYVALARRCAARELNWLDVKEIACPGCERTLGWQLRSPFCDSFVVHCDACPRQVEIPYDDEVYTDLEVDLMRREDLSDEDHSAERDRLIEERLSSCPCGGAFRFEASRRCPHCSEPIPPQSGDVGEYSWREAYTTDKESAVEVLVLTEDLWRT